MSLYAWNRPDAARGYFSSRLARMGCCRSLGMILWSGERKVPKDGIPFFKDALVDDGVREKYVTGNQVDLQQHLNKYKIELQ